MDKELWISLFVVVGIVGGVFGVFWLVGYLDNRKWAKVPKVRVRARLLSQRFKPSTEETHAVPMVTGNGVGIGVSTSGESEEYITVWDCGKYGKVVSDDEELFRYSKDEMVLFIKELDKEIRVVDFEK